MQIKIHLEVEELINPKYNEMGTHIQKEDI